MDLAGTFFADFMTILIALQDKSVSFHFANIFDLDKLDFFEFISDICRYGKTEIKTQWGRWISAVKKYDIIKSFWKLDLIPENNNNNTNVLQNASKCHWKNSLVCFSANLRMMRLQKPTGSTCLFSCRAAVLTSARPQLLSRDRAKTCSWHQKNPKLRI